MGFAGYRVDAHTAHTTASHSSVRVDTTHHLLLGQAGLVGVADVEEWECAQQLIIGIGYVAENLEGSRTLVTRLVEGREKTLLPPCPVAYGEVQREAVGKAVNGKKVTAFHKTLAAEVDAHIVVA